jgi:hypothetical protein
MTMDEKKSELRLNRVKEDFLAIMGERPNHPACQQFYDLLLEASFKDEKCKVLPDINPNIICSALSRYEGEFVDAYTLHLTEWGQNEMREVYLPVICQGSFDRFLTTFLFIKRFGKPEDYDLNERSVYYSLREGSCLAGRVNIARDVSIQGLNNAIGEISQSKRFWYTTDLQQFTANGKQPLTMDAFTPIIANAKHNKPFSQQRSERSDVYLDAFD